MIPITLTLTLGELTTGGLSGDVALTLRVGDRSMTIHATDCDAILQRLHSLAVPPPQRKPPRRKRKRAAA
jgi:hypothetical protein